MDVATLGIVVGAVVIVAVWIQWIAFVVIEVALHSQESAFVVVARALNQNICIPRQHAQRRRHHSRCQDQL